jgi:hypothetical protein
MQTHAASTSFIHRINIRRLAAFGLGILIFLSTLFLGGVNYYWAALPLAIFTLILEGFVAHDVKQFHAGTAERIIPLIPVPLIVILFVIEYITFHQQGLPIISPLFLAPIPAASGFLITYALLGQRNRLLSTAFISSLGFLSGPLLFLCFSYTSMNPAGAALYTDELSSLIVVFIAFAGAIGFPLVLLGGLLGRALRRKLLERPAM